MHPGVAALYFAGALMLTVWMSHPVYLATLLACMLLWNFLLDCGEGLKKNGRGILFLALMIMVLNPLFSSRGATILGYFRNRPVTWESFLYGITFALMLATMLITFQAYQRVVTVDKFLYLTSSYLPRTAFVIVMVMRLIPLMRKRLGDLSGVSKTLGRFQGVSRRQRIREWMEQISALLVWTLEESLHTATSMRSRGYGSGPRSTYQSYKIDQRDCWLTGMLLIGGIGVFAGGFQGLGRMEFFPVLAGLPFDPLHYTLYFLWISLPVLMDAGEVILWRRIKSRM